MKTKHVGACLIAALALITTAASAQNPFAGTWKIDYSQSKVTGTSFTFAPEPSGAVRGTWGAISYSFKTDGSDTTTPFGNTDQWTKVDDNTWKVVARKGSTDLGTDTYKLSGDGKTLQVESTGTKPNGDRFHDTETYTRVTPGKGFFGKWKSTSVKVDAPNTAQIDANGNDGITWHIPEIKAQVALKFDGKDVAATGPTVPDGLTLAATRTGPRSFTLVEKLKGKPIWKATITVSEDGQTMTQVGSAAVVSEPETLVYKKS